MATSSDLGEISYIFFKILAKTCSKLSYWRERLSKLPGEAEDLTASREQDKLVLKSRNSSLEIVTF